MTVEESIKKSHSILQQNSDNIEEALDCLRKEPISEPLAHYELINLIMKSKNKNYYKEAKATCYRLILNNNPHGYLFLARLFKNGRGTIKDEECALSLYNISFRKGVKQAGWEYVDLALTIKSKEYQKESINICNELVSKNDPLGMIRLARIYKDGKGVPEKPIQAMQLYKQAYRLGLTQAGIEFIDLSAAFDDKYATEAISICTELVNANNPEGILRLARIYKDGKWVPRDLNRALQLSKKASSMGLKQALWEVTDIYYSMGLWNSPECKLIVQSESDTDSIKFRQWLYRDSSAINYTNMPEELHFLLISTDNYFPYTDILIRSICKYNSNHKLVFHVVTDSSSNYKINRFKNAVSNCPCTLNINKVDVKIFDEFEDSGTWHKLRFAKLLPHIVATIDSNKVLYLDIDIVVCGDISELFQIDLKNYALAGAKSSLFFNTQYLNRELKDIQQRINAGVILFNLEYFRNNNVDIEYYIKKMGKDNLRCTEETTINNVFRGNILFFDEYTYHHKVVTNHNFKKFNLYRNTVKIFHFEGSDRAAIIKPWECFGDNENMMLAPDNPNLNSILSKYFKAWWDIAKESIYYKEIRQDDIKKYNFYKGIYNRMISPLIEERHNFAIIESDIKLITNNKQAIINFIERNNINKINLCQNETVIHTLSSIVSIPVTKSNSNTVESGDKKIKLQYGIKQMCNSPCSVFDVICSLGYDCELTFMIKHFYGYEDNYITSWARVTSHEGLIKALSNLDLVMSEGMTPDSAMVLDNYSKMRFHTRGAPNISNPSELNKQLEELESRLKHLCEKTKQMFNSSKRKLFIIKYEKKGGLNISEYLNRINETLSLMTTNYTLLCVLQQGDEKEIDHYSASNVTIKTISKYAFPARNFNIMEWKEILSTFEPYLFLE